MEELTEKNLWIFLRSRKTVFLQVSVSGIKVTLSSLLLILPQPNPQKLRNKSLLISNMYDLGYSAYQMTPENYLVKRVFCAFIFLQVCALPASQMILTGLRHTQLSVSTFHLMGLFEHWGWGNQESLRFQLVDTVETTPWVI